MYMHVVENQRGASLQLLYLNCSRSLLYPFLMLVKRIVRIKAVAYPNRIVSTKREVLGCSNIFSGTIISVFAEMKKDSTRSAVQFFFIFY